MSELSLRDVIAEALNTAIEPRDDDAEREPVIRDAARHDRHRYHGRCYVCRGDVTAMADAVQAALIAGGWEASR